MIAPGPSFRLLPRLGDDSEFFWTSGADGQLRFLHCPDDDLYFHPPAPVCPKCLSTNVAPKAVSGRATLLAFTENFHEWIPGSAPYVVALVAIDEQPDIHFMTNLVGVQDATELHNGMALEVEFEHNDDVWLPLFKVVK